MKVIMPMSNFPIYKCIPREKGGSTVNSEIFTRILFLQKALKDIFAMFKILNLDMIYLHQ